MKTSITTLFILLIGFSLFAQAPESFNYQGVARDLTGQPITDTDLGIKCSIVSNSAIGTTVYEESHAIHTNNLGLFQLEIGNGNALIGIFSDIDWGNGSYFLKTEIDVDNNGTYELLGASKLLSVPYALYAKNSGHWNQSNLNNGIQYPNTVTVGTNINTDAPFVVNKTDPMIQFNQGTSLAYFNRTIGSSTAALGIYGYPDTDQVLPHLRKSSMIYATDESQDLILCAANIDGAVRFITDEWTNPDAEIVSITKTGLGVGAKDPKAKVHVKDGDIYIEDASNGVIMTSPNGQCWKMTVDDSGQPVFSSTACPN